MASRNPKNTRSPPRSPPRNFKVNLIDEPPFDPAQRKYLLDIVPKIGKTVTSAEDFQLQLSTELCKYLKEGVGVSVVVTPDTYSSS